MYRADYAIPTALGLVLGGCGPVIDNADLPDSDQMCQPQEETYHDSATCESPTPYDYDYASGRGGWPSDYTLDCAVPQGSCCPEGVTAPSDPGASIEGDWTLAYGTGYRPVAEGSVERRTTWPANFRGRLSLDSTLEGCAPMVIETGYGSGPYSCSLDCSSYDFSAAAVRIGRSNQYKIRLLEPGGSLDLDCTLGQGAGIDGRLMCDFEDGSDYRVAFERVP